LHPPGRPFLQCRSGLLDGHDEHYQPG